MAELTNDTESGEANCLQHGEANDNILELSSAIEENTPNQALYDVEDERDLKLKDIAGADFGKTLPSKFSRRSEMTDIKRQGTRGSCVSHAFTAWAEWRAKQQEDATDLSEQFLFDCIKKIDMEDYKYSGYGAYLRSGAKALSKYGICKEELMPYDRFAKEDIWVTEEPTTEALNDATNRKIDAYISVNISVAEIKKAIHEISPVIGGINIYSNIEDARRNGGLLPAPIQGEKSKYGHAMLFIGWNDDLKSFEVKNSYGSKYGDNGYLWIPYEYFPDNAYSFWVITKFNNKNLKQETMVNILKGNNRKAVTSWALRSWDKADKKGLVGAETKPHDVLTKQEYFVMLDKEGRLD
jgi:C1A family cysteine protease